jgi:hypothetical protein
MKRQAARVLVITVALVGAAAAFLSLQLTRSGAPTPARATVCQARCHYVGVALTFQSQDHLIAFEHDTRFDPGIVANAEPFGLPFPSSWARTLLAHGILPLIMLNPRWVTTEDIANGRYDGTYLNQYAAAVRALDAPVGLAFGTDMNGSWNPWGYRNAPPGEFVRAWRHIHQVFAAVGARKVIWVWEVAHIRDTPQDRAVAPNARPWWPGAAYVDWVALDVYYQSPATTFQREFVPSITAVRRFTDDPILLKTAVPNQSGQVRQIADLFAGAQASDLLGVIWFNQNYGHQTWQLGKSRRAAITAFRRGAASLLASR